MKMTWIFTHGLAAAVLFLYVNVMQSVPAEASYRYRPSRTYVSSKTATFRGGAMNKTTPRGNGDANTRPALDHVATASTTSIRTARRVMDLYKTTTSRKHPMQTFTASTSTWKQSQWKLNQPTTPTDAKLNQPTTPPHAKLNQPTTPTHAKLNQPTTPTHAKLNQPTTPTHAKLNQPTTSSTVSTSETILKIFQLNTASARPMHQISMAAETSLISRNNSAITTTARNDTELRHSSEFPTVSQWRNVSVSATTSNSHSNENATLQPHAQEKKEDSTKKNEDFGRKHETKQQIQSTSSAADFFSEINSISLFTNVSTQLSPHLESVAEEKLDISKDQNENRFNQTFSLKNGNDILNNTSSEPTDTMYQTIPSNGYMDNEYSDERMEASSIGSMDIDSREITVSSNTKSTHDTKTLSNARTDYLLTGITETNIRNLTADTQFSKFKTNTSTSSSFTTSPKLAETTTATNEPIMSQSSKNVSTTAKTSQQTETQTRNIPLDNTLPSFNVTTDSIGAITFSEEVSSSTGTYVSRDRELVKTNATKEITTTAVSTHSIPQQDTDTTQRPIANITISAISSEENNTTDLTSRNKGQQPDRQDTQSTVSIQRTTPTPKTTSANFKEIGTNKTTGELRQHSTSSSPQNSFSSRTHAYRTDTVAIGTSESSRNFYSNYSLTLPIPTPTGAAIVNPLVGHNTGSDGATFTNTDTMSTSSLPNVDRFRSNNSFHSLESKPTVSSIQSILKRNLSAAIDKVYNSSSTIMTPFKYNHTIAKDTLESSATVDYATWDTISQSSFAILQKESESKFDPGSSDASTENSKLAVHPGQASRSSSEITVDLHGDGVSKLGTTGTGQVSLTSTDNKKTSQQFIPTSIQATYLTDYVMTSLIPEDYWTAHSLTKSSERTTLKIPQTYATSSLSNLTDTQQGLSETSFESKHTVDLKNSSLLTALESSFKSPSTNTPYKHTTTTSPSTIQYKPTENIISSSMIEVSLQAITTLSFEQATSLNLHSATEVLGVTNTSITNSSADITKPLTTLSLSNITEPFIPTVARTTLPPITSSNTPTQIPTTPSSTNGSTTFTTNTTLANATLTTKTETLNTTLSTASTNIFTTLSTITTKSSVTTSATTTTITSTTPTQPSTTFSTTTSKPSTTVLTSSTQPTTTTIISTTTASAPTTTPQSSSTEAPTTPPTSYSSITSTGTTEKQTPPATTAALLQLGSPCNPIIDICNYTINESVCIEYTCSCIWYSYKQNNLTCTKYSENDFTQISIVNISKESITLQLPKALYIWPNNGQHLDISVTWSSGELSGSVKTNQSIYKIESLNPGTVYSITVQIVLKASVGSEETFKVDFPSLLVMTDPPDPGQLVSERDVINTLVFSPPTGTFDTCTASIVELDYFNQSVGHAQWVQFNCTNLNIATLKPGINYKVIVCVNVSDGSGQTRSSPWKSYFISLTGGVPGPVENLTVSNITSTLVTVTWSPPKSTNGYITAYEVILNSDAGQCTELLYVYSSETDKQTRLAQTCSMKKDFDLKPAGTVVITLFDLKVAHDYVISVVARNHRNLSSPVTAEFTTASEEPKSPSNVTATIQTSTSVVIKWSPPSRYPGPTDYVIQLWNSSTVMLFRVQGYHTNNKELKNLSPGTCYNLHISSNTSLGASTPVEFNNICLPDTKSGKVTTLNATSEPGSIKLSWAAPEQPNGQVKGYAIYLWSSAVCQAEIFLSPNKSMQLKYSKLDEGPKCSSTIRVSNITLTTRSFKYTIQNLTSCQQYIVSVAAVNDAGVGMTSIISVITTTPVPQTPSMLKCQSEAPGSITFLWQRPANTSCSTFYHLTLYRGHKLYNNSQSEYKFTNITVTSYTNVTFNKLDIYWPYTVLLNASTSAGVSSGSLSEVCRSLSDVPGPVGNVTNSPEPSNVTLTWSCPAEKDRHGEISEFHVNVTVISSDRRDLDDSVTRTSVISSTVPAGRYPCRHQYNLSTQMLNQIAYKVQIRAKVKDVEKLGQPGVKRVYFPAQAPKALLNTDKLLRYWTAANSANDSSTSVNICLRTLLDNSQGEILAFGVLVHVCFDEVCNAEKQQQFYKWPEYYLSQLTWSQAKEKSFTQSYRATHEIWQKLVRKNFTENIMDVNFTVGDNFTCDVKDKVEPCNGPIPPRHPFRLELFSCTLGGCTSVGFPRLFYSAAAHTESSSDSIVIGGAVGGMTLAVVVLTVVVIIRLRVKLSKRLCKKRNSDMDHVIDLNDIEVCKDDGKSKPIRIREFDSTLSKLNADDNVLLNLEYQELNELSPIYSMDVGTDLDHHADNRWTNIIPFDHSRVKLKVIPEDLHARHDYINGNFISGADSSRDYIATQGPLTRTIPDFWRMVWEQKVTAIVMLSDFEEMDKRTSMMREKVAKYYVDDAESNPVQHGHIQVTKTCKVDCKDWEIRTLKLTHTTEKKCRLVKHFFFKYWSDHEADINPADLIEFVRVVRSETSSDPPSPLVIHCSAGVGRTGTFIAVDYFNKLITRIKQRLDKGGQASELDNWTVDIFGRVLSMREKRRFMVQTKAQYAFIYEAVKVLLNQAFGTGEQKTPDKRTGQRESSSTTREDAVYDDVDSLKGQVAANSEPTSTL